MIFLGLDIGSTGCKCAAYDETGRQVALRYREYPLSAGQADMDAAALWEETRNCIAQCAADIHPTEVVNIAVTSFGEACCAIDREGSILHDFMMYTDKRGEQECAALIDAVGFERLMQITCERPDAMYSLPKILWMCAQEPHLREKVWKFLQPTDFICYQLTGEATVSANFACRTMAYDVAAGCWSREILDAAGLNEAQLPAVVAPGSVVGTLRRSAADALGLPASVAVINVAQDQVCASIGAGVLRAGEAVDGTGSVECVTPLFAERISSTAFHEKNFVCVPHVVPQMYCTYAFNFSGGVLLKWFRDSFAQHLKGEASARGVSIYRLLDERCPTVPSDVLVVPHFLGAGGTPDLVGKAKGTITGLTMQTTPGDLYRAVMEGLTFEIAYNLRALREFGITVRSLRATGGGASSPIWRRIKADILNCPITPVESDQAGACGCAMTGAVAAGAFANLHEAAEIFVRCGEPTLPDPAMRAFYDEKFGRYAEARNAMLALWRAAGDTSAF